MRIIEGSPARSAHTFSRPTFKMKVGLGWKVSNHFMFAEDLEFRAVLRPYYTCELLEPNDLRICADAVSFSFMKVMLSF
jgi:hypothetical protein